MSKNKKVVNKDEKYVLTGAGRIQAKADSRRQTKGNNELSKSIHRLMFQSDDPVDPRSLAKQLKKSPAEIQITLIKGIREGLIEKIEAASGLAL